jgi:tetratricopeptide (TPR) repeat protein
VDSQTVSGSGLTSVPTNLDRARALINDAAKAPPGEQLRLAREALEICSGCIEAYLLLARHVGPDDFLPVCVQAAEAARQTSSERGFDEYTGWLWNMFAHLLWEAGRPEAAAYHYREILRLNPKDNLCVRWCLSDLLLDLGRDGEIKELLAAYKDDCSAQWTFTKALLAYREIGDSTLSRELLAQAVKSNPYAVAYLLGNEPLSDEVPPTVTPGGKDEALSYAQANRRFWLNAPGAISWVQRTLCTPLRD